MLCCTGRYRGTTNKHSLACVFSPHSANCGLRAATPLPRKTTGETQQLSRKKRGQQPTFIGGAFHHFPALRGCYVIDRSFVALAIAAAASFGGGSINRLKECPLHPPPLKSKSYSINIPRSLSGLAPGDERDVYRSHTMSSTAE